MNHAEVNTSRRDQLKKWVNEGWMRRAALANSCSVSRQYIDQLLSERGTGRVISDKKWPVIRNGMEEVQRNEWNDIKQLKYQILRLMKKSKSNTDADVGTALSMARRLDELEQGGDL